MTEHQLFLVLVEVAVLVVGARLGGELALRLGIPQVVGELVVGICLGPSLFGWLAPAASAHADARSEPRQGEPAADLVFSAPSKAKP